MHIGALGFVYRNTKEPITEIKAVVKENHNNSLSSLFFSAGTFWQLAPTWIIIKATKYCCFLFYLSIYSLICDGTPHYRITIS